MDIHVSKLHCPDMDLAKLDSGYALNVCLDQPVSNYLVYVCVK